MFLAVLNKDDIIAVLGKVITAKCEEIDGNNHIMTGGGGLDKRYYCSLALLGHGKCSDEGVGKYLFGS